MTKILITGASGMVGKHLVDMCLDKGYYVRGTDIRLDDRYLEERYWGDNFDFFQVDLRDFDDETMLELKSQVRNIVDILLNEIVFSE